MPSSTKLQLVPNSAQVLSPQQKKFNTLMQRIGKQRDLLRDWEAAILLFRQRYMAEMEPLQQEDRRVKHGLLSLFDDLSGQKLAKADRAHLQQTICAYVDEVLPYAENEAEHAALKAIFNRHAAVDYDTEQAELEREQDEVARSMLQQMFGVELDDDELATPESVLRKLQQQFAQQAEPAQAAAMPGASARQRSKKPSARELRQEETEKQASQSVREIYRKLASSLHPDRETDPAERERKTALMQRVNQAYAAGQLLQLLELQLEIEQIDTEHIAGLSEQRLKHYNQVLETQWRELQQEVAELEQSFLARHGMSPFERYTPKKIGQLLSQDVAELKQEVASMQSLLQGLTQDPSLFKRWLKEDRALLRQHEQALRNGMGFFF